MAKRQGVRRAKSTKSTKGRATSGRSARRPSAKRPVKRQASAKKKAPATKASKKALPKGRTAATGRKAAPRTAKKPTPKAAAKPISQAAAPAKVPRLDRARRTLDEAETHTTPPSSLDMNRHGTAARSGRAGMEHDQQNHHGMSSDITGGDVDVDVEDAYFTGDEAPGGDNPTPDQDIVEDIGKALGVTYDDAEELKGSDKVTERDKHRWEMDPASSEDYKDRT